MCIAIKRFLTIIFKIVNIALMLCGIAIMIVGILVLVKASSFWGKDRDGSLIASSTVFIIVGVTMFGISFLGCCGFKRHSMICLVPYAVCQVVVIVALVIVCIALGMYSTKKKWRERLSTSFNEYRTSTDQKFWDWMQVNGRCCGLDGPADWTEGIPESCCDDEKSEDSKVATECRSKFPSKPYLNQRGCVDYYYDNINKYWTVTLSTALILMAVSLLALIVALIVICGYMHPGVGSSTPD